MDEFVKFLIENLRSLNGFQVCVLLTMGGCLGLGAFFVLKWLFKERLAGAEKLLEFKDRHVAELTRDLESLQGERQRQAAMIAKYKEAVMALAKLSELRKLSAERSAAIARVNCAALQLLLTRAMELLYVRDLALITASMLIDLQGRYLKARLPTGVPAPARLAARISDAMLKLDPMMDLLDEQAKHAISGNEEVIDLSDDLLSDDTDQIFQEIDAVHSELAPLFEEAARQGTNATHNRAVEPAR